MRWFKYLKLILQFKQVTSIFKSDTGKDKSVLLGRTALGSLITVVSSAVVLATGYNIDQGTADIILNQLSVISTQGAIIKDAFVALMPSLGILYGIALAIKGRLDKEKK